MEELRASLGPVRHAVTAMAWLIALFLALPILVIVPQSFTGTSLLTFPPDLFSTRWYDTITGDPAWRAAFSSSFQLTAIGAGIATVTGTSAALAMRRRAAGSWLTTWFLVPLVIPWIVYALGVYLMLDQFRLIGQSWAVAAGQAMLAFPLVFVTVSAGLAAVDRALPRAARSLGSRWPGIVWRIELPLVGASIVAGGLFAVAFCFDEIVVALFVTSPDTQPLPVQIFQTARDSASPAIAAASTVVMGAAVVLLGAGSWVLGRRS